MKRKGRKDTNGADRGGREGEKQKEKEEQENRAQLLKTLISKSSEK